MGALLQKAEETNCENIAQQLEQNFPDARIRNLGFSVVAIFRNKAVASVFPLTADAVDIFAKDARGDTHDLKDFTVEQCLELLRQISEEAIHEENTSDTVGGYNVPGAFAAPGQNKNRGTEQSEREGWRVVEPLNEVDRLEEPFGKDPLGEKERKKISENQSPEMFSYLGEVLPVDAADIDGNTLNLKINVVKIAVTQQNNGNFSTVTQIDGETVQTSDNVSAADLIKWLFEICDQIQQRIAAHDSPKAGTPSGGDDEISADDVFETLKRLAVECGIYGGDDPLRNKSLLNLNALVARPPFDPRRSPDSFMRENSGSYHVTESFVPAEKMKNGAPVRLFENLFTANASKPYSMMNDWTLVNLGFPYGCQVVKKSDLPNQRKLNWCSEHGVYLSDQDVPLNTKGIRRFTGFQ